MLRSTFSALRDRRYAAFFTGQVLSNTGTWMERAALSSLVYALTGHDERWLAFVAVLPAIPAFGFSMWAGAIVDRVDVRRFIVGTQVALLVLAALLAALASAGLVQPWHVAVYTFVASSVFVFDAPARQSFVPRIVDRKDLTNALALSAVTFNVARLLGGAAFGFVMVSTTWGWPGCFWLNAASFVFPVIALSRIRENVRAAVADEHRVEGLLQGVQFAWRTPIIRGAVLVVLLTSLLGFQVSHLVPVYAEKVWRVGVAGQGTLHAYIGLGALAGGLSVAAFARRVRRGPHVLRTAFLASLLLALAARSEDFTVALWLLAGAGFLLIQTHTCCNALIQSHVPDALRGRVVALFTMCVLGAFPVGGLLAGWAAHSWGAPVTTVVSAALLALSVLLMGWGHRELREAD